MFIAQNSSFLAAADSIPIKVFIAHPLPKSRKLVASRKMHVYILLNLLRGLLHLNTEGFSFLYVVLQSTYRFFIHKSPEK